MATTAAKKRWLFIVNPNSGTGNAGYRINEIQKFSRQKRFNSEVIITHSPGHATDLAKAAVGKYETVVAVGGDGTVREVAIGLKGTATTMGILPVGSGNGLARHLGISIHIDRALRQLETATIITMDGYTVNGKWGFNVAGIGFDAAVSELFAKQKRRGLATYLKLAVRLYRKTPSFIAEVNGTVDQCFVIAFANSTQYGNDAVISGHSSVNDGLLECILLKKPKLFSVLWMALCLRLGWYGRTSPARKLAGKSFHVKIKEPQPFHIDGEYLDRITEAEARIEPGVIKILIPHSADGRI